MRKLKNFTCACLVLVLSATGLLAGAGVAPAAEEPNFVPGEVIIGFEEFSINTSFLEAAVARGGTLIKEIQGLNAVVVKVNVGNEDEYIRSVMGIAGIRYAERNGIVQAAYTPSDPYWGYQWNMRIIEADKAWNTNKGSASVMIAIIDTGVDYNHQDLAFHYVFGGYDWVNDDSDPWDDHSHGTHCAGIAAAVMDNGVGVVGVAQCSIWAEKVLDHAGYGDWGDLASGIKHATDNGVDIISMSLGGYDYSSLVKSACTYAWNKGVLLVAAAGNDNENIDSHPHYPASFETVMAVSATTSSDRRWLGSNYGNTIELAAPGAVIYSTIPSNEYGYMTGTSMACPHVAGVAALIWSEKSSLTNAQLRNELHTNVVDLGAPSRDIYYGYGRINAYKPLTGEFKYHFRLDPFINLIHLNTNPGGWLNGYMTGGTTGWNPILGRIEAGRFYIVIDIQPDASPENYEMIFLVGTLSTKAGQLIQTYDGMSYDGPIDFKLALATTESQELQGLDITEASGLQVTPKAWHTFKLNPYIDVVHLNINPGKWMNGYDAVLDVKYPVLGFLWGGRFHFAIDTIATPYTLVFNSGAVSTMDGEIIRTVDGTTIDGPDHIWLSPA